MNGFLKYSCILTIATLTACGGGEQNGGDQYINDNQFEYQFPPINQQPPAANSPVALSVLERTVLVSGGSGFIVRPNYILTNWHVVRGHLSGNTQIAPLPITLRSGEQYNGQVKAFDSSADIALVKISSANPLSGLALGQSGPLRQGDALFSIGNRLQAGWVYVPGNYIQHAEAQIPCEPGGRIRQVVRFSGDVADGNSGGALFNSNGQVVGLVSCRQDSSNFEIFGLAIPSETLLNWLNGLPWAQFEA